MPPQQFAAGHVTGARQLSAEQSDMAADSLKKYKDKMVVVYGETGSLGAAAVRAAHAQGFTKVFTLRGGLAAWRAEDLPLSRG